MREETEKAGVPLIFDEIVSGFRVARGGITERFGVKPDGVTLGKIIGGGFPVGAFLGPDKMMMSFGYTKAEFPVHRQGSDHAGWHVQRAPRDHGGRPRDPGRPDPHGL